MSVPTIKTAAALLILVLFGFPAPAAIAQAAEPEMPQEPKTPPAPPKDFGKTGDSSPSEAADKNASIRALCDLPEVGRGAWIDRMHRAVYKSVCGSAIWFDNFFGEEDADRERDATFGRIGTVLLWSEHEELKLRSRFKVKLSLPRFEKRVNAFFGNFKEDEFTADRPRNYSSLPEVFRDTTDQEWLVGLGYSPARGKRQRIDVDAGVRLDFPMDPFVRVRIRRYHFFREAVLLRFRQTVFWRGEKGVGTTSHFDFERVLGPKVHLRWRTLGTIAETIEGIDWETGLTFYQYLGENRALAYEVRFLGETDAAVTVEEYGLRTIYRQSVLRDWFFLEFRGALTWPRLELAETRRESFGVGFGFELLFGNHP